MIKNIFYIMLLVLIAACASSEEMSKSEKDKANVDDDLAERRALSYFIDGNIQEMKGDMQGALTNYLQSYKYDSKSMGINYSLAKTYLRLNKLKPALNYARQAFAADSTNKELNYLMAYIFDEADLQDSVASTYERIIRHDSLEISAYYNLAKIYEVRKPSYALELYNKAIDIFGPEWSILIKIAELNEKLGNVEATVETIENLIELNPSNDGLKKLIIDEYVKNKDYDKAGSTLDDLLVTFPNDIELMEKRAKLHLILDEFDPAKELYFKIFDKDDLSYDIKLKAAGAMLGEAYQDSTDAPFVIDILEYIDKDTTDWQVKAYLAEAYLIDKRDSVGYDYFAESTQLAKWNLELWVRFGGLLFEAGEYKRAGELADEGVKQFKDNFVINLIGGLSYSSLNEHDKAEPYLSRAVQLNPNDFSALYSYGFTLNRLDKPQEAVLYIERAIELQPGEAQLYGTLGMIYEGMEEFAKCDSAYEKAMSIDSTDALLLNNYAYSLISRDKQVERARRMAETALSEEPENSSYLDTMGWIHFKFGEYEQAKELIEKSLEKDKENPEVIEHLGDVYFKLGNKQKALELWKKAYKFNKESDSLKQKIEKGTL